MKFWLLLNNKKPGNNGPHGLEAGWESGWTPSGGLCSHRWLQKASFPIGLELECVHHPCDFPGPSRCFLFCFVSFRMQEIPTYFPAPSPSRPAPVEEKWKGWEPRKWAEEEDQLQCSPKGRLDLRKLRRSRGCQICLEFGFCTPASTSCWKLVVPCWPHPQQLERQVFHERALRYRSSPIHLRSFFAPSSLSPVLPSALALRVSDWPLLHTSCVRKAFPRAQASLAWKVIRTAHLAASACKNVLQDPCSAHHLQSRAR